MKKWRKAVKAKGAICIKQIQNDTGSRNVYRTGRLTWTGQGLKGMVRGKPGEVGWGHKVIHMIKT